MPQILSTFVAAALATGLALSLPLVNLVRGNENTTPSKKINAVILSGGHPFEQAAFLKVFQHEGITYKHVVQKQGGEVFENIAPWPYDVIVLYNFKQEISPRQQENFVKLLEKGVGLVILHHAVAAYVDWPLYKEIAGVQYHTRPWELGGKAMPASDYKHGVTFKVDIADPGHPIAAGLTDFEIVDETYRGSSCSPAVRPMLTTDEPSSDPIIGFVKTYGNARVCYLQPGHGRTAYENPSYRTLVVRAIRWTAGQKETRSGHSERSEASTFPASAGQILCGRSG